MSKIQVFPITAKANAKGHLVIGGCDVPEMAEQLGTPLYIFDEATLRHMCTEFKREFTRRYTNSQVIYACKAYINPYLARLLKEEGLGLDVVSGGEMAVAKAADFPPDRIYFHGNNKGKAELEMAVEFGVGRIVVDNFHELSLLNEVARRAGVVKDVLLRVSPGIDPHTHGHTTTGILDSKFGIPIQTGQAEEAVKIALSSSNLKLLGFHFHLGSPIYELEPYRQAVAVVMTFAAEMRRNLGQELLEFSPGGGFAIQYTVDSPSPPVSDYAEAITSSLLSGCEAYGMPPPRLIVEPGRAIVGRAGVAIYTVGSIKEIPGVRKYVSVDGGMGDNIRPAIYGARYEALVANKMDEEPKEKVTIAGKFCESGDILVKDIELTRVEPGDIIAIPAAGAYCLSMASNYNAAPNPPIVSVKDGSARLIRRRETWEDLMSCDLI